METRLDNTDGGIARARTRRDLLAGAAATVALTAVARGAATRESRLIIDTHLEVWTLDPRFPFNHPERGPDLNVTVEAPIDNQVGQMRDFAIRYAVLINPHLAILQGDLRGVRGRAIGLGHRLPKTALGTTDGQGA